MTINYFRYLLVLILVPLMVSCGFRLRDGSYHLPADWRVLAVETRGGLSAHSGLTVELKLALQETQDVDVRDAGATGMPKVMLLEDRFRNPVSTIDALGRAQEYLLEYIVYYKVVDGEGKEVLPKQRIYLRQEQTYSSKSILAKEQETVVLKRDLQRRAANRIIERLLAVTRSPAPAAR